MNFVELCRRVHLITRIGEEAPGTQPTTVVGVRGVTAEIVQWVAASYDDILSLHTDWRFLTSQIATLLVPEGERGLDLAAVKLQAPDWYEARPFVGSDYAYLLIRPPQGTSDVDSSEQEVRYVDDQAWWGHFDVAPIPTGQPSFFTVPPTGGILFDTTTDRDYTVRIMYRPNRPHLTADADVPIIPEDYQLVVVWWAIVNYYCVSRDGTGELLQKATKNLRRELTNLRNTQLPSLVSG